MNVVLQGIFSEASRIVRNGFFQVLSGKEMRDKIYLNSNNRHSGK